MLVGSFVLVLSYLAVAATEQVRKEYHLPNYIVPCKVRSPDFQKCIRSHGTNAIPHLLKGDPKLHSPPLVPFKIDKVELKPNDRLTLTLRNVELYGLDTIEFRESEADLEKRNFKGVFFAKNLKVSSVYHIEGQILVLPISGEGPAEFQFEDNWIEYSINYDLITKKDGKRYFANFKPKFTFKAGKAHYNFENLFNGNKELGENMNKVLNENSQEVLNDFGIAIAEIISAVVTRIFESYLLKTPFDEIFPQ